VLILNGGPLLPFEPHWAQTSALTAVFFVYEPWRFSKLVSHVACGSQISVLLRPKREESSLKEGYGPHLVCHSKSTERPRWLCSVWEYWRNHEALWSRQNSSIRQGIPDPRERCNSCAPLWVQCLHPFGPHIYWREAWRLYHLRRWTNQQYRGGILNQRNESLCSVSVKWVLNRYINELSKIIHLILICFGSGALRRSTFSTIGEAATSAVRRVVIVRNFMLN
jgi:hypothetical protein